MRRVPMPEPVPPPSEWASWNPWEFGWWSYWIIRLAIFMTILMIIIKTVVNRPWSAKDNDDGKSGSNLKAVAALRLLPHHVHHHCHHKHLHHHHHLHHNQHLHHHHHQTWRQSQPSDSFLTTSNTESTNSAPWRWAIMIMGSDSDSWWFEIFQHWVDQLRSLTLSNIIK